MTVREDADEVLLRAVAEGDRRALETLYRRHAPWLLVRLARRCADPGLVEEVVQDTFVAVWRGAGGYRGTGEVPAWLWGIGIRRLIDRLRRQPGRAPRPAASEAIIVSARSPGMPAKNPPEFGQQLSR